jgi:hypothetical protein
MCAGNEVKVSTILTAITHYDFCTSYVTLRKNDVRVEEIICFKTIFTFAYTIFLYMSQCFCCDS